MSYNSVLCYPLSSTVTLVLTLVFFIQEIEASYCSYVSNKEIGHFYCGAYEHCCGRRCCRNSTSFYRLWYFWLCMMLALMFCSVGGYWYRRKYYQQRVVINQNMQPTTTVLTMTGPRSNTAPYTATQIGGAGVYTNPPGQTQYGQSQYGQPQYGQYAAPPSYGVTGQPAVQLLPGAVVYQSNPPLGSAPGYTAVYGAPPPSYDQCMYTGQPPQQ